MGRVALIVLLSITAAAAADKDKGRFAPGPASSYRGHQTMDKITIAAVPFVSDEQTRAAYVERGMGPFTYESRGKVMTMAYHEVPPDVLENAPELTDWARRAIQLAATSKKLVKRTKQI